MKLIRHGSIIVALPERNWEKAYLTSRRGEHAWIPGYTNGWNRKSEEETGLMGYPNICSS